MAATNASCAIHGAETGTVARFGEKEKDIIPAWLERGALLL